MNYTTASCGCYVPAVGAPGSIARHQCEIQPCGNPMCESVRHSDQAHDRRQTGDKPETDRRQTGDRPEILLLAGSVRASL